jgi:hypothetical protein
MTIDNWTKVKKIQQNKDDGLYFTESTLERLLILIPGLFNL